MALPENVQFLGLSINIVKKNYMRPMGLNLFSKNTFLCRNTPCGMQQLLKKNGEVLGNEKGLDRGMVVASAAKRKQRDDCSDVIDEIMMITSRCWLAAMLLTRSMNRSSGEFISDVISSQCR
jgi:hypothetical protein